MEKKIIDLEIIDEVEESGTQKISLVDAPAIEKNWMYFKKVEKFVKPEAGESESDYMGRCVPNLMDEGKEQDQAVAICISTYENMNKVFEFDAFAEYPWDECISDANKRGLDDESAAKLCGWIKANMEINTGNLAPYTEQVDKKKKDLVTEPVNFSAILAKARELGFAAEDFTSNGLEFHEDYEGIDVKLAKGYTVYKYSGGISSNSRDFCREMVNMDRFYTFEEIQQLSATDPNPGFGLGGSDNYDLWLYKGGPMCKHYWRKFYITEAGSAQNKGKAPGTAGEKPIDMPNNGYAFAAEDKRELVGAVAIPDQEIYRRDKQGNPYYVRFSKEVIQKMMEKFMREQKLGETNVGHQDIEADTYVFESWIVENAEDKANSVYKLDVPIGTWCVKMRVTNEKVWEAVKAGKLNGFSLEGSFVTKEEYEDYMKNKKMFENLVNLVNSF